MGNDIFAINCFIIIPICLSNYFLLLFILQGKLHLDSLLQQYEYSLNSSVTREQFINVCPGFVFMLLGLVHTDHDHHEIHEHVHTEHEYSSAAGR